MNPARTVAAGDVLVEDGVIAAAGPAAARRLGTRTPDMVFDASGCFVLPGFVQCHLHLCQTLFRARAEQTDLLRWLREAIWPLEAAHTEASIAASARLGLLELMQGGVTCINDMGTVHHTDAIGEVLLASGIRAVFGKALMDRAEGAPERLLQPAERALEEGLAVARRFEGAGSGRLRVSLAPRFILSCSEGLWRDVAAASAQHRCLVHTHLAESSGEGHAVESVVRTTAARYFAQHDVLSPRFVGAHGVWLDAEERSALRAADAALVHCPGSNLKLGSGLANVRTWLAAGIRSGIGSDGAACNNRLDTFAEMSLAAGVSRVVEPAAPLSASEVVELATIRGAAALGWDHEIGSIEPGKQADLIVIDARGPHVAPSAPADPYAAIVHASRSTDVRLTMVAGRVLYRDGAWSTLDPERVVAGARFEVDGLLRRAGVA